MYIHRDGRESSVWTFGESLHRFGAFERRGGAGTGVWLNSIKELPTWFAILVGRPSKRPHEITKDEILDIYERFGVHHQVER